MPTILYEQGFRFSFFASDGTEPPHVHVTKGGGAGKWWLDPGREAGSRGLSKSERTRIARIIRENHVYFRRRWEDFFSEVGG